LVIACGILKTKIRLATWGQAVGKRKGKKAIPITNWGGLAGEGNRRVRNSGKGTCRRDLKTIFTNAGERTRYPAGGGRKVGHRGERLPGDTLWRKKHAKNARTMGRDLLEKRGKKKKKNGPPAYQLTKGKDDRKPATSVY